MSIIRAIKHRLGLSVTPANNFVLTAEADNGTMKLARESGQDIMTVDAAGKVAFPQNAQTWQVVTGSRSIGTTYTNDTGREIKVRFRLSLPAVIATMRCTCQGVVLLGSTIATTAAGVEDWAIPAGATYNVEYNGGSGGTYIWQELR